MARVVWAFRTVALGLGYAPDTVYEYIPAPNPSIAITSVVSIAGIGGTPVTPATCSAHGSRMTAAKKAGRG
jgi:hypothetical protein